MSRGSRTTRTAHGVPEPTTRTCGVKRSRDFGVHYCRDGIQSIRRRYEMVAILLVTNISTQTIRAIVKKELPDTLLMGFNHMNNSGYETEVVSLDSLPSGVLTAFQSLSGKSRGFSVILGNRVLPQNFRDRFDMVLCQYVLPIGLSHSPPFAVMDIIVYEGQPFQRLLGAILKQASFVTYNARTENELLTSKLGLDPACIEYLPWGVDSDFYKPDKNTNSPESKKLVVSVGNASRDYVTLAKALNSLNEAIECTIVVGGSLKFRARERRYGLDSVCEIHRRTRVVPSCHPQHLRALYARASAVVVPVYPSASASGVTSLLEAMAMEKTCIAADSPGLSDYVENERNALLYESSNHLDLAMKIRQCLRDEGQDGLSRRARRTVEERFSTKMEALKIWQVVQRKLR